jgi:glycosyltransferase involved in cell wall biosynthesis
MTIGIGLTTRNRYETFKKTYDSIIKFMPPNAKFVVIDDCSDIPVKEAAFRFEENVGIARAKNKAIELLEGCEHIFLADDDFEILKDSWWLPYISSGINHMSYTFDKLHDGRTNGNTLLKRREGYNVYQNPCGVLLYFTKKCFEVVGGMNTEYGLYGYDHVDLSIRIKNAGLTPYSFMDIPNSSEYFRSADFYKEVNSSVPPSIRGAEIKRNKFLYQKSLRSKEFIPYKEMTGRVITTYFTGVEDPQRGHMWQPDVDVLTPLVNSVKDSQITVISNCLLSEQVNGKHYYYNEPIGCEIKYSQCKKNPYFQRWISILEYLKEVKEDYVFCVDATDVVMLNNPFKENLGNYLWVGDETGTIRNEWLQNNHNTPMLNEFFKKYRNMPLLNAGIVGGRKNIVEAFVKRMVWHIENSECGSFDMGIFNYVLYTEFASQIKHGRKVNTPFKSYSKTGASWFAHK